MAVEVNRMYCLLMHNVWHISHYQKVRLYRVTYWRQYLSRENTRIIATSCSLMLDIHTSSSTFFECNSHSSYVMVYQTLSEN